MVVKQRIPTLAGVMTPFPYSIEATETIDAARAMMEEHGIRHLPVTQDRELIGALSERDVRVAQGVSKPSSAASALFVSAVCSRPPYVVELSSPLHEVVSGMAERGIGSAVVVRQGRLAGILTTTDVCLFLARLLRDIAPPPEDDDVA